MNSARVLYDKMFIFGAECAGEEKEGREEESRRTRRSFAANEHGDHGEEREKGYFPPSILLPLRALRAISVSSVIPPLSVLLRSRI
jgi:hypothetical protein